MSKEISYCTMLECSLPLRRQVRGYNLLKFLRLVTFFHLLYDDAADSIYEEWRDNEDNSSTVLCHGLENVKISKQKKCSRAVHRAKNESTVSYYMIIIEWVLFDTQSTFCVAKYYRR